MRGDHRGDEILVVEDDLTTIRYAGHLLKERFTVVSATTVRQACEELDRRPRPAAVVIDGRLPDGQGITVARRAHGRYPDLAMLFMTGHPDDHELANFAQSIGAEYAVKPGGSITSFARRVVIRQHIKDETLVRRTDAVAASRELTLCQTEVLALAVAGASREKIASVTQLSINTVKTHALAIGRICRKTLGDLAWGIQTGDSARP